MATSSRRLSLRLSVRVMMLLIVVAACALGWVVHRAREQRLAVQAILARGGIVEYDFQYDAIRNRRIAKGKSWLPLWVQKTVGDDYFHSVVCVGLDGNNNKATDADLALIAHLKHIKLLYLGGGQITDAGLKHLENLTDLRLLILGGNPISGAGLEHLRGLKRLNQLDLGKTRVTDSGLSGLSHLTGLERIDVDNNPQLTGKFLRYVADLPFLREYNLRGTGTTDSALVSLDRSKRVEGLMLDRTRVTDAGLIHLRGLSNLRALDLSQTAVTDEGMARVYEWFPLASVKPTIPAR